MIVLIRTILDNFGHLSASDRSILMACPFQRIGTLLEEEEARQIAVISDRLLVDTQQPPPPHRKVVPTKVNLVPAYYSSGELVPKLETTKLCTER